MFNKEDFSEFYYIPTPMIIDNFNLRKITCGDDFTMVLTKDGKMYVFGANYNHQLGVLKERNIFSPLSFPNLIKSQAECFNVNVKSNIIDMQTSGKNCVLINEEGNVIVLSSRIMGSSMLNKTPVEMPLPNVKFSNVECGKDFVLLLTHNGYVYSFGENKYGQLGLGDTEPRSYPTLIKDFLDKKIKVTQISCGYKHCSARGNNKAFSWGCNNCGQLGASHFKNLTLPYFNDIKYSKMTNNIIQVSCGFRSTVFLTESRQLFWCGSCGDISQQDVPIEFDYVSKVPELFGYDSHHIIKVNHSWSRVMSVLYATVAETAPLKFKLNNPNKLKMMLNTLTNKWTLKDLYPPKLEGMENFIAAKHIVKVPKTNTTTIKKK
jgi:alpha-tubulin suppressor-like RCC1 family protein